MIVGSYWNLVGADQWTDPGVGQQMVDLLDKIFAEIREHGPGQWALRRGSPSTECPSISQQQWEDLAAASAQADLPKMLKVLEVNFDEAGIKTALSDLVPEHEGGPPPSSFADYPNACYLAGDHPVLTNLLHLREGGTTKMIADRAAMKSFEPAPNHLQFRPYCVGVAIMDFEQLEDPIMPRDCYTEDEKRLADLAKKSGAHYAKQFPDIFSVPWIANLRMLQRQFCPEANLTIIHQAGGLPLIFGATGDQSEFGKWFKERSWEQRSRHPQVIYLYTSHTPAAPEITEMIPGTLGATLQGVDRTCSFSPILNQANRHSQLRMKIGVSPSAQFEPQDHKRGSPRKYL